jgi:short-subunit dehydrogenase
VFINNAAQSPPPDFYHNLSAEMADNLVAINCASVVKATYAVLPSMLARGKGAIVNISSVAGVPASLPMVSLYSATKSFVIQLSLSLSDEYKDKGIDVQVRPPPGITCKSSTGTAGKNDTKSDQNERHLLQLRVHVSCHPSSVHTNSSKCHLTCNDVSALNYAGSVVKVRCVGPLTTHGSFHVQAVLSCKHKSTHLTQ